MNNIEKTQNLLKDMSVPDLQQTELCALTLLAMANLKPNDKWDDATNEWIRIHDIISFIGKE